MSKKRYNEEQIASLRSNPHVAKCSDRSISYHNNFKLKAVKQYNEGGITSNGIFRIAGFDLNLLGDDTPKQCLKRWNKKYREKGEVSLQIDDRGRHKKSGRPKTKDLTEADKIKRLEAEVAYLKAENDFLAKLRAKRAE